jgi:AraC-like DNA-binding protein
LREKLSLLDDALAGDSFQRAATKLARDFGRTVSGRVGSHGVVFLVDSADKGQRLRSLLVDLATRASTLARRFGFKLHTGIARTSGREPLSSRYREALAASERALSQGIAIVHGEPPRERSSHQLRALREELGALASVSPNLIAARFDRYVEAVLQHSGYHLETARGILEAGFERLVEPLVKLGVLEEKGLVEIWAAVERANEDAGTTHDLASEYRRLAHDVERVLASPLHSRHDRGTQRALGYIRDHLRESLSLAQVAKIAGFAPQYFSRLLKRDEGVTFEGYLRRQRLVSARHMLADTELSQERIAKLAGFGTRSYFHRVFKRELGQTPEQYRIDERGRSGKRRARAPFGTSKSAFEIKSRSYSDETP